MSDIEVINSIEDKPYKEQLFKIISSLFLPTIYPIDGCTPLIIDQQYLTNFLRTYEHFDSHKVEKLVKKIKNTLNDLVISHKNTTINIITILIISTWVLILATIIIFFLALWDYEQLYMYFIVIIVIYIIIVIFAAVCCWSLYNSMINNNKQCKETIILLIKRIKKEIDKSLVYMDKASIELSTT
jgi:uncharacterized membrane protein YqjE